MVKMNVKLVSLHDYVKEHQKQLELIKAKRNIRKQFLKHRLCLLKFFNRDPYACPKCGTIMEYACEIIEGG